MQLEMTLDLVNSTNQPGALSVLTQLTLNLINRCFGQRTEFQVSHFPKCCEQEDETSCLSLSFVVMHCHMQQEVHSNLLCLGKIYKPYMHSQMVWFLLYKGPFQMVPKCGQHCITQLIVIVKIILPCYIESSLDIPNNIIQILCLYHLYGINGGQICKY